MPVHEQALISYGHPKLSKNRDPMTVLFRVLAFSFLLLAPLSAHAACTSPAGVAGQLALVGGVAKSCDGTNWGSLGGGTPGGSNTQVQFNNSGAFGGDSALVW